MTRDIHYNRRLRESARAKGKDLVAFGFSNKSGDYQNTSSIHPDRLQELIDFMIPRISNPKLRDTAPSADDAGPLQEWRDLLNQKEERRAQRSTVTDSSKKTGQGRRGSS